LDDHSLSGQKEVKTIRYPELVERLKALAETARLELGDSLTLTKGRGVRPPGRKAGPFSVSLALLSMSEACGTY
jgi:hypothetical protein